MNKIKKILKDIKTNGDNALIKYNTLFDNNSSKKFELTKREIKEAYKKVDKETIKALKYAAKNIKFFAKAQMNQLNNFELETSFGKIGQRVIPLQRVGCYVPGGNYPLPSTALMTVVPAKVAGVKEIIVCSPKISSVVIVAADIAKANRIFNIGGVQAIGAMAYGTKQVPKVDKIVGPGNKYVTEAKRQVFGEVGIDFIAGPSEVLIIADKNGKADLIAADLLAQAEHDTNAKANFITTSKELANQVEKEIKKQLYLLETKNIAEQSIKKSKFLVVKNIKEAINLANDFAPEHLEIQIKNPKKIIPKLTNYGSLFVGQLSAESLGDYCLGPNHTLPTNKAARYTGGLSVKDFVKIVTVQRVLKIDKKIIKVSEKLAEIEGLYAHKKSAEIRNFL